MDLKDLNNQQLVLLALLVSFVTSVATGIVTVTLMDQAPPGITQTINRVVEKTVRVIAPEAVSDNEIEREVVTETIIIKEEDLVVKAAERYAGHVVAFGHIPKSTFRILRSPEEDDKQIFSPTGGGFIVSADGHIITDSRLVEDESKIYAIKTTDENVHRVKVLQSDTKNHLALLEREPREGSSISDTPLPEFEEITFANSEDIKIGQTAIALRNANGISLLLGVFSRIQATRMEVGEREVVLLYTTIQMSDEYTGTPLVDTDAHVVGINIVSEEGDIFTVPSRAMQNLLNAEKNGKKVEETKNKPNTASVGGVVAEEDESPVSYESDVVTESAQTP